MLKNSTKFSTPSNSSRDFISFLFKAKRVIEGCLPLSNDSGGYVEVGAAIWNNLGTIGRASTLINPRVATGGLIGGGFDKWGGPEPCP